MNLLFCTRSRRKEARPEIIIVLSKWECIRVSHRPNYILLLYCFYVLTGRWHFQHNIGFVVLVYVIYDVFHLRKFFLGILIREVTSHRYQNVLAFPVVSIVLNKVDKLHHLFISVESLQRFICDKWVFRYQIFPDSKSWGVTVVSLPHVCKNLMLVTKVGTIRSPKESHSLVFFSLLFF